jgi:hypothetical protein
MTHMRAGSRCDCSTCLFCTGCSHRRSGADGAAVNTAFIDHFQTLARGHFTVRRLERIYGKGTVRLAYEQIRSREDL